MRAVLLVVVFLLWVSCLFGAVGLTAYLTATATRALRHPHRGGRHNPPTPPPGMVMALVLFAVVMMAAAAALAGVVMLQTSGPASSALASAWFPLWAALSAVITAVVLWRRKRISALETHRP